MNIFFESIETENTILTEKVVSLETENFRLNQQLVELQKALDKQTKYHRKFTEDMEATEKIRTQDFKEEKRSLTEGNKLLTKENRQLSKVCSFYKNAFEELAARAMNQRLVLNRIEELQIAVVCQLLHNHK